MYLIQYKNSIWAIINIISSINTILYFLCIINIYDSIYLEIIIASIKVYFENKWSLIINKSYIKYDLIVHHLLLYLGFILIHIPLFQEYAHIFIYMQNIHIPLSFYYLYKCTHYSLWYRLYLITWPITITRSTTLIYYTYSSYVYKQYLSFVLLLSLFILILYIDYLWTPWNRYILLLK